MYGTRTQALDPSHPHLGKGIELFKQNYAEILNNIFKKKFPNERELTVYGEFLGPNSFAGLHTAEDPKEFVLFDILVGHKQSKFLTPQDFLKLFADKVKTPKVIYAGKLNDSFIQDVRAGNYPVKEGVICKGVERSGAFSGNVWMCKIKTQAYLESLTLRFGQDGIKKYGE